MFRVSVKPKKASLSCFVRIQEASMPHLINEIRTTYPDIHFTDTTILTFKTKEERDVIANDGKWKGKLESLARMNSYDITINFETCM